MKWSSAVAIMEASVRAVLAQACCQHGVSSGCVGRKVPQRSSPCAITLRMTFGSASSASVAIGTQRIPPGARVRAATFAV